MAKYVANLDYEVSYFGQIAIKFEQEQWEGPKRMTRKSQRNVSSAYVD